MKSPIYKSLVEFHLRWEEIANGNGTIRSLSIQDVWPLKQKIELKHKWNTLYFKKGTTDETLRKLAQKINNAVYLPGIEEQLNREMEKNQQGRTSSKR